MYLFFNLVLFFFFVFLVIYCTYIKTGATHKKQHFYKCYSCDSSAVVCSLCAKLCHFNHDISYFKEVNGFCDCANDLNQDDNV